MTRLSLLLLLLLPIRAFAVPVVPQFRSGSSTTSSTSESVINETITSHQYRTGYSYAASGHNIKSETGYINPTPTTTNEQTVGGVNFSWTSPNLEAIPRWSINTDGAAFSIQETLITPGLDTITNISRTIQTSTTTETTTTFGQ
ncbi:hypothetical protein [uncultured Mediterranean phage uvMED]|nr:hypothetical protein [uncultured Mediterranean phage uvMED]